VHAGGRRHLIDGSGRRVVEEAAQDLAPRALADGFREIVQGLRVYSVQTL